MINSNPTHIRRTALAALAALAAFGAAHTAAAQADVTVEKTALGNYFVGAGPENNDIHIESGGSKILISDTLSNVVAGANCVQATPKTVECPDLPEGGLYVSMGAGTDKIASSVTETLYVDGTLTTK